MDTINLFFNPKNVVLFGASDKPGSVGETTLKNLLLSKDTRTVYIVHPKHETLLDIKCYPSLAALPETPELAVIATGADHVPEIVEDCGKAGIKAIIIISSGFNEAGQNRFSISKRSARYFSAGLGSKQRYRLQRLCLTRLDAGYRFRRFDRLFRG